MMKHKLAVAIFSGLILAVVPLVGCGETDDPTGNDDNQNQNQNNDDLECEDDTDCDGDEVCEDNECVAEPNGEECEHDTDCDGDEVCEDNKCVDPNGNGHDPECESDLDCEGSKVCEGEGDDAECVDPPFEFDCEVNESFYGQIGFDDDVEHSGGEPTTDALETDAGLSEVIDAIEAQIDGTIDGEEDEVELEFSEPISIEGATVTAVEFIGFWIEDSEAAIYVFNSSNNENIEIDNPDVGQKVNFEVDIAGTFFADPQITGLSEWEVVEESSPVRYHEVEEGPITNDEHFNQVIRVAGQFGTGEDDIYECGEFFGNDQICYNMYYGEDGEHSVTFRTSQENSIWEQGDCMTYVGPVQSFPGYYSENGEPQLQETNWDWTGWPSFE